MDIVEVNAPVPGILLRTVKNGRISREYLLELPSVGTVAMISTMKGLASGAVDLLFPSSCVHCGRDGELICTACVSDSTKLGKNVCRKCAESLASPGTCARCLSESPTLDRLYGSFLYDSPVGTAIRTLKFDDVRALSGTLAELFDIEALNRVSFDVIVPIPLHKSKLRSRGFNQSELIAQGLAKRMNVRISPKTLIRTVATDAQSEQPTAAARKRAVQGVFSVVPNHEAMLTGKRVLLVDVFTTGSTLNSAAGSLQQAGAAWVGAAVLAVQPIGSMK